MSDPVIQSKQNMPLSGIKRQNAIVQQRDALDGCLAVYEAFRRFGFKPEEVFFDLRISDRTTHQPCVGMTLRTQGKEFVSNCGIRVDPAYLSDDELLDLWNHHAGKWNTGMTPQMRQDIWQRKMPMEMLLSMALHLKKAGFIFPNARIESDFADFTSH